MLWENFHSADSSAKEIDENKYIITAVAGQGAGMLQRKRKPYNLRKQGQGVPK